MDFSTIVSKKGNKPVPDGPRVHAHGWPPASRGYVTFTSFAEANEGSSAHALTAEAQCKQVLEQT